MGSVRFPYAMRDCFVVHSSKGGVRRARNVYEALVITGDQAMVGASWECVGANKPAGQVLKHHKDLETSLCKRRVFSHSVRQKLQLEDVTMKNCIQAGKLWYKPAEVQWPGAAPPKAREVPRRCLAHLGAPG